MKKIERVTDVEAIKVFLKSVHSFLNVLDWNLRKAFIESKRKEKSDESLEVSNKQDNTKKLSF